MTSLDDYTAAVHLERHVQTIIQGLLLAGIIWVGSTLLDVSGRLIKIETQVAELQAKVLVLSQRTENLYFKQDAAEDFARRDQSIQRIWEAIRGLISDVGELQARTKGLD